MQTPVTSNILPMPAIEGVTVPHQGLHYLRPELLLDFISVTPKQVLFVTPVAVLCSTLGVLQRTELRKIPVAVAGRVTYPVTSLEQPCLHSRLIINAANQKLRYQGALIAPSGETTKNMTLVGLALEFTVVSDVQLTTA